MSYNPLEGLVESTFLEPVETAYHHEVLKQRSLRLPLELGSVPTHVKGLPVFLLEQRLFLVYRKARMLLYILNKDIEKGQIFYRSE